MRAAADAGFDVLVTVDQNLRYQQSSATLPIAVVVLCAASNDIESLRGLVPSTLSALATIKPGELVEVRAPQ
ncbi:MAG TPA: hypothetical protein VHN77_14555 [Phycisphaerales bacterium]|nr:hypothetical protein [Phycisphaerales bacterium]